MQSREKKGNEGPEGRVELCTSIPTASNDKEVFFSVEDDPDEKNFACAEAIPLLPPPRHHP